MNIGLESEFFFSFPLADLILTRLPLMSCILTADRIEGVARSSIFPWLKRSIRRERREVRTRNRGLFISPGELSASYSPA